MRALFLSIALVATTLSAFGCKPKARDDNGTQPAFPQMTGTPGDATALTKVGIYGKGGASHIAVDLGRLPPAGSAALYACWSVPPDTTVLGRAACVEDQTKSVDLVAANVDFTCVANPNFPAVKAKTPLSPDFCDAYTVYSYPFTPALPFAMND
jgi:hypothetical protein